MKKFLLSFGLLATCSIFAQDPALLNPGFDPIAYTGTGVCGCALWINKDLGNQGETSNWTKNSIAYDGLKFDNNESDVMYQEVEVIANTDYKLTYHYRISNPAVADNGDDKMEIRVLKGTGYTSGYTPTYYTDPLTKPTTGFGYVDYLVVENSSNNLALVKLKYPGDDNMYLAELTFNSGSETSIAIFARGIGGIGGSTDGGTWVWSASDEETRLDYVALTNESTASTKDVLASKLNIYPNPAKDYITVESKSVRISSVAMYNLLGAQVISEKALVNSRLNVSGLAKGIYMLKIEAEGGTATKKIVIE